MGFSTIMGKNPESAQERSKLQKIVEAPILYNILGSFLRYTNQGDTERIRNIEKQAKKDQNIRNALEKKYIGEIKDDVRDDRMTFENGVRSVVSKALGLPEDYVKRKQTEDVQNKIEGIEKELLRATVNPKYENKLTNVFYTGLKDDKLKVFAEYKQKMSAEDFIEMVQEAYEKGFITKPVRDEALTI
jgi:hypothetical protein